jgi:mRNA-degrading endonuclease toxin of MazEF toxin-antitoxin module
MSAAAPAPLKIGTVVAVALPARDPRGVEIEGLHPAVVLAVISAARLDLAWIVPITTDRNYPWVAARPDLYIRLDAGTGGLPHDSVMLLDQLQAVDLSRLKRAFGVIPSPLLTRVRKTLAQILGFAVAPKP